MRSGIHHAKAFDVRGLDLFVLVAPRPEVGVAPAVVGKRELVDAPDGVMRQHREQILPGDLVIDGDLVGGDLVSDLAFDGAPEGHQVNGGAKQASQLASSDAEGLSRYRGATFVVPLSTATLSTFAKTADAARAS